MGKCRYCNSSSYGRGCTFGLIVPTSTWTMISSANFVVLRLMDEDAATAPHGLTGMVTGQASASGAAPPIIVEGATTAQPKPTKNNICGNLPCRTPASSRPYVAVAEGQAGALRPPRKTVDNPTMRQQAKVRDKVGALVQ